MPISWGWLFSSQTNFFFPTISCKGKWIEIIKCCVSISTSKNKHWLLEACSRMPKSHFWFLSLHLNFLDFLLININLKEIWENFFKLFASEDVKKMIMSNNWEINTSLDFVSSQLKLLSLIELRIILIKIIEVFAIFACISSK